MNMDDYFAFMRQWQQMVENATGMSQLRTFDEQIRKAVQPLREPYESLAMRMAKDATAHRDLAREALLAAVPYSTDPFLETVWREQHVFDEYVRTVAPHRSATMDLFVQFEVRAEKAFRDLHIVQVPNAWREEVARVRAAVQGLESTRSSAAIATALNTWTSALGSGDATVRALMNPLDETARFFRKSARLLGRSPTDGMREAIEGALLLTDVQLRATTDLLAAIEPVEIDIAPPPPRLLLAPTVQRFELRGLDIDIDPEMELEEMLAAIPAGQVGLIAREVITLFLEVMALQRSAPKPIFKLTERIARVCAELPFAVAINERTFADLIDDLYWLLYESPGAGTLRYLVESGGPLTTDDCEIVFVIKRLRNYLRHDPDHGSPGEIAQKHAKVKADLRARGAERLRTRDDYRALQRVLLEEATVFLRQLVEVLG